MTVEQFVMTLLVMVMSFSIGYDLCGLKYKKRLREKDEQLRTRDSVIHSQNEVMADLRRIRNELEAELAKVNDPETQLVLKMRKQMQDDHDAFNLLCNYGAELAYGQVTAGDIMGVKEGRAE